MSRQFRASTARSRGCGYNVTMARILVSAFGGSLKVWLHWETLLNALAPDGHMTEPQSTISRVPYGVARGSFDERPQRR